MHCPSGLEDPKEEEPAGCALQQQDEAEEPCISQMGADPHRCPSLLRIGLEVKIIFRGMDPQSKLF